MIDEDFEEFLEAFSPVGERVYVPESSIARYAGKLPGKLLEYWKQHGWCSYANGLLWTVNPREYEPALEAWIGNTPFMEFDPYHVIARTAFGQLIFWGERTGNSLVVLPYESVAIQSKGKTDMIAKGRADEAVQWFFGMLKKDAFEVHDKDERPLFNCALTKLGALRRDEMYGFVPALAAGRPATLDNLQKVKVVEQLVLLAQLSTLKLLSTS